MRGRIQVLCHVTVCVCVHRVYVSGFLKVRLDCSFAGVPEDTVCVGVARLGSASQKIIAASLKQMASIDLGDPLHSLVIAGHLHFLESDMLKQFAFDDIMYMQLADNSPRTDV